MRCSLIMLAALAILAVATPAQVELNEVTGSLTSGGLDPTPGTPFLKDPTTGVDLTIGGYPGLPFILAAGNYALAGTVYPALANQVVNLDISAGVLIVGDPYSGNGALPSSYFYMDGGGHSSWTFPVGANNIGMSVAFQAITTDPSKPFGFNVTAAADFSLVQAAPIVVDLLASLINLDDAVSNYTFAGGPYYLFGQPYTGFGVGTNGYITFTTASAVTGYITGTGGFLSGMPYGAGNPAPMLAVMWDDLDYSTAGSVIMLTETPGLDTIDVQWSGSYSGGPTFGSIGCSITFSAAPVIEYNYNGYLGPNPSWGIIGISNANVGGGADHEINLASGGVVNSFSGNADYCTFFQNFGFSTVVAPEPFDLGGTVLHAWDQSPTGEGNWLVF